MSGEERLRRRAPGEAQKAGSLEAERHRLLTYV
jgi:hypothetical protein